MCVVFFSFRGIVTRKAVVEGSAPPPLEQHLYDTVAYSGVVPVKVSRHDPRLACECPAPRAGQLLVPSGRNDGTALLAPATESADRVGILLDDSSYSGDDSDDAAAPYRLVQAVVVAPTETVRGSLGSTAGLLQVGFSLHFLSKCTKKGQFLHISIENR